MADLIIEPLTRIIGNAGIRIRRDETGRPQAVSLRAFGYRGFDQIAMGAHIENLLPIVSRICGNDSVFHQVAAAIAVEKALDREVPEGADRLRELAMWGQLFERHAVSLTVHSLPDLLFPSSDPGLRNIISINRVDEEVVKKLMVLKSLGTSVLREAGGRAVHPVNFLPGGAVTDIPHDARKALLDRLEASRPLLIETSHLIKLLLRRNEEVVNALGTRSTSCLSARGANGVAIVGKSLEALSPEGEVIASMNPEEAADLLREDNSPHTHIRSAELSGLGETRVGPMSRLNVNGRYGTEQADEELEELKSYWGFPLHRSMISHAARILEMIHAWERMRQLLGMSSEEEVRLPVAPAEGRGVAAVEAPEGTLVYRLEIGEEGLVKELSITSPLQFNLKALEASLLESAMAVMDGAEEEDRVVVLLETAVRAYAPCIPCGMH